MVKRWPAGLVCAAALASSCNRVPAQEALAEADQQLEAARPLLEAYAPERLPPLRALRKDAGSCLRSGEYTQALRLAQRLPAQIESGVAAARTRRDQLVADWGPISGRVPLVLEGARRRAAELAARTPPRGLDAEGLDEVRTELRELEDLWRQASAQYEAGQVARAVEGARDVQTRVQAAGAKLGLSPAAAMAVAAAPAPSPGSKALSPAVPHPRLPSPPAPASEPAPSDAPAPEAPPPDAPPPS